MRPMERFIRALPDHSCPSWEAQWLLWLNWGSKDAVFIPTFDLWVNL